MHSLVVTASCTATSLLDQVLNLFLHLSLLICMAQEIAEIAEEVKERFLSQHSG